jgi:Uma2 family endonuclease
MGTTAVTTRMMSLEEYFRTSFEPDADFVDGEIEERNLGEWDHARLQGFLYLLLAAHEEEWGVFVQPELRIRVSATRVRVPDVCVTDARNAIERVPTKAPLLCVEVKSPEDRLSRMFERVKDFHRMGVGQVWVFDPETRRVWLSTADAVAEWGGGVLTVPGTKIELDPAVAFAKLDRRR